MPDPKLGPVGDPAIDTEHQPPPSSDRIAGAVRRPAAGGGPATGETGQAGRGLPRLFLLVVGAAGLAFSLTFLQGLSSVIAPLFLALNLMIAAHPIHTWLANHGIHRHLAAIVTGAVVLAFLIVFFWTIGWSVSQLVTTLPQYSTQFESLYAQLIAAAESRGVSQGAILDQLRTITPSSLIGYITPLVSNVSAIASLVAVVVVVVFFMTMDSVSIDYRLDLAQRYHPRLVGALRSFAAGVRRYWVVSSVFGLIAAACDVIALQIIGVPLPLVWGLLAFLTNYIPNIGFFIGLIPPALLGLLALGPPQAVAVVVAYLALNFVLQSLIMPRFTGAAVGITATLTFVSLLFWAWLLGVLGALLAIPLTLFFKAVLIDADPAARWANALIASDPLTFEGDDDAPPSELAPAQP